MSADVNADLIGYSFTDSAGDPPATWTVIETDKVLGANYVHLKNEHGWSKCQNTGVVRRRKEIEAGR